MAEHYSAVKRARQTVKRTLANRTHKTHLRKTLRRFREALAAGNKAAAQQIFGKTVSAIDKAIRKGVIHRNTAARYKSRLNARLKALK